MPKITAQQALEVLKAAGVAEVEISDTPDATFTVDTALQAIDASRTQFIKPLVVKDLKDSVHGEMLAKTNKSIRKHLGEIFGFDVSEIANETDTEKMLTVAKTKFEATVKGDLGKDKEAFIKERDELIRAHQNALKEKETTFNTELGAVKEQLTAKEITAALTKLHAETKGLPVSANKETLASDYHNYLKSFAIVKLNDKGEVELYDKANPDLRLKNAAGTLYATPAEFIDKRYGKEGLGILNSDTRNVRPELPKDGNYNTQPKDGTKDGLESVNSEFENWAKPQPVAA